MFPTKHIWTVVTVLIFIVPLSSATQRDLFTAKNVCPFECCTYGNWPVLEDTTVQEYPDIDSQILRVLVQGDVVAVATGEVRVIPGIARIVGRPHRTAESLDRAANVEILDYIGEGYSRVRQQILEEPDSHWWFSLTRLSGAVG